MTRLIDADALWSIYKEDYNDGERMLEILEEQPTVDAVPVVHGRWIADESTYTEGYAKCSVCNTTYYADDLYCVGEKAQSEMPNYCPHCGSLNGKIEGDKL